VKLQQVRTLAYTTEAELCELLYKNPNLNFLHFSGRRSHCLQFVGGQHLSRSITQKYLPIDYKEEVPVELFDTFMQEILAHARQILNLDIAQMGAKSMHNTRGNATSRAGVVVVSGKRFV
jgi:hypothetical protein